MTPDEILDTLHDAAAWHGGQAKLLAGMAGAAQTRRGAPLPAGSAAALAAQHDRFSLAIELAMQCAHHQE